MLELVQMKYMTLMIGSGRNNFIIEWNAEGPDETMTTENSGDGTAPVDDGEMQ